MSVWGDIRKQSNGTDVKRKDLPFIEFDDAILMGITFSIYTKRSRT